jgi:hypothetical protein
VVCFVDCEGGDGCAHEVVVVGCHLEFGCRSAVKCDEIFGVYETTKSLDHGTGRSWLRQRKVFKKAIL